VTVYHLLLDFNSGIQIFIVKQGDNLYLTCYLTGPNVTWHTPKGSVFGRNLNLTYITSDFQGYYFCSDLSTNITEPEEVNGEFISATSNLFYLEVLGQYIRVFYFVTSTFDSEQFHVCF
jgi:hypothetical protein